MQSTEGVYAVHGAHHGARAALLDLGLEGWRLQDMLHLLHSPAGLAVQAPRLVVDATLGSEAPSRWVL